MALGEGDYSMILIPDTQFETNLHPEMWISVYEWIVANAASWNAQAVIGLGDIVDLFTESRSSAVTGWDAIRSTGLPILPLIGNHDYNSLGATRDATNHLAAFGSSYFVSDSNYVGCYNGSTENYYIAVTVGEVEYIIFGLEFYPRDEVITWAQGVVDSNTGKKIIVVTHGYLDAQGDRIASIEEGYPLLVGNTGTDLWTKLIQPNSDIFLVLCGHMDTVAMLVSGTTIQHKIDYQETNYGNGQICVLVFRANGTMDFLSYSTLTLEWDLARSFRISS